MWFSCFPWFIFLTSNQASAMDVKRGESPSMGEKIFRVSWIIKFHCNIYLASYLNGKKTVYSDYKVLSKFDNLCQFLVYVCWGWVGFVNFFFRLEFESSWLFRAVRVFCWVAECFGRSINWLELDLVDLSPVRYNRTMNHNRVFFLEIVEKILGRC